MTVVPAELPLADACPSPDCHPGDSPACLPIALLGTIATYRCIACGLVWATMFDRFGWPVERSTAPALERDAA